MNWIIVLVVLMITATVFFVLYDSAIILASTIFGSYFFIRGLSLFFGGYPTELSIAIAAHNAEI